VRRFMKDIAGSLSDQYELIPARFCLRSSSPALRLINKRTAPVTYPGPGPIDPYQGTGANFR
jgi:hypothetical protein